MWRAWAGEGEEEGLGKGSERSKRCREIIS